MLQLVGFALIFSLCENLVLIQIMKANIFVMCDSVIIRFLMNENLKKWYAYKNNAVVLISVKLDINHPPLVQN